MREYVNVLVVKLYGAALAGDTEVGHATVAGESVAIGDAIAVDGTDGIVRIDDVVIRFPSDVLEIDGVAICIVDNDDAIGSCEDILVVEGGSLLGANQRLDTPVLVVETQFDTVGVDGSGVGLSVLDNGGGIELELRFSFLGTPHMGLFDFLVGRGLALKAVDIFHIITARNE